ncbi:hypothetical protein [Shimia sp. FJ5]|uniref:hypothetical protein n=2 Tax=Shimia TaxID=573139 RepID=UPI00293DB8D8|nr:hypothetical protein [Shimia sp. FJ5]MDV4143576.1 hypothetical protein [Shimia sp. FJ5]
MVARRAPDTVMTLARLGSLHQSRLSFMRQLTRRMANEGWRFDRRVFDIDDAGVGHAVFTAHGPARTYSLVAFAHDLPPKMRSDRVIATAWDATFALFDGIPTQDDIDRLSRNVPLQEAGRVSEREISVSRANRSVRLWDHIVDALSRGQQPDPARLAEVGYLMRTTAVYGSGKLGAADREVIADRPEMQAPFQAEMLSVYLTRWFVRDLIEHMARARGGKIAVPLAPQSAQRLGIGNSTGLGMAPFLVTHPVLFNNWIMAREEAIARVRSLRDASVAEGDQFRALFSRAALSVAAWKTEHPIQIAKLADLRRDVESLRTHLDSADLQSAAPWDRLMRWAETHLSLEGQEWLASLILEPYGALVDGLGACMADAATDAYVIDGAMTVRAAMQCLEDSFGWALKVDWAAPENCARAWYVSEEKLEPRLGERFEEPIAPFEQPLAPARDAAAAHALLRGWDADAPVADVLATHPAHRNAIRRAQITKFAPYGEIRSNTIGADLLPIDMLRAKLSFFGVTHFDPRSDRWVRVSMYAGAPYPSDLCIANADDWVYPEVSQ